MFETTNQLFFQFHCFEEKTPIQHQSLHTRPVLQPGADQKIPHVYQNLTV